MKTNSKKKILSGIAVLAVSATAVAGALAFTAGRGGNGDLSAADGLGYNGPVVQTALGEVRQAGSGKTYYVDPDVQAGTGTGETPEDPANFMSLICETSIDNPQSTHKLQPGDTVKFKAGTYHSATTLYIQASGTYNNYITFEPENEGDEVILDFSEQSFGPRGVTIYGNYIHWKGIDICGAGDNGMLLTGSYNTIELCEFYNNRDTGLQIARAMSSYTNQKQWPNYNLILNCTSHNNYDNETRGENADGFASKLTVGYGNVFDGCIAYRNSDDGWDLFAKSDSGLIGTVVLYNCVAFENGFMEYTQKENNDRFPNFNDATAEPDQNSYKTELGDGNGFKLGGSTLEGDVLLYNCLTFNNRMHGVTDNSNPGVIMLNNVTSFDNSAVIDNAPKVQGSSGDEMIDNVNFGKVKADAKNEESHANVDMSRHDYSYNTLNGILSVSTASASSLSDLSKDVIRGSVRNSILSDGDAHKNSYKYTDAVDEDSKVSQTGEQIAALVATEVFEELPKGDAIKTMEDANKPTRPHKAYRNDDGSVNMGNILKIKDQNSLIEGQTIGANLSETSDTYQHYYTESLAGGSGKASEGEFIVEMAKEALEVATDTENVYQDFDVPKNMMNCEITWEVDGTTLELSEDVKTSLSGGEYNRIIVHRDATEDKTVTLTATIKYTVQGGQEYTATKEFTIKVIKAEPKIGEIVVIPYGADKEDETQYVKDGESILVDMYSIYREPEILVYDGSDYNGKTLSADKYSVQSKYMYQADPTSPNVEVKGFTPSAAGTFTITHTVTANVGESTGTFTYKIFVASTAANVQFDSNGASISLNVEGFQIKGGVTNPTGSLYALSSASRITFTDKQEIKDQPGVVSKSFRADNIAFDFANENVNSYYIYYALANVNGDITSDVAEVEITAVDVSTADDFIKVASGKAIGSEVPSKAIYKLTKCLDFTGNDAWSKSSEPVSGSFAGLLNGQGHTISGISAPRYVFEQVDNGTIMNVKFKDITINNTSGTERTGIIGMILGGYLHNIQITDVAVSNSTAARVGVLVGQAKEGYLRISQVSIINKDTAQVYCGKTSAARVGGIIGFIQCDNNKVNADIKISDCYVKIYAKASEQIGSIVGSFDGNNAGSRDYVKLEIEKCISASELWSTKPSSLRVGGIIGYQSNVSSNIELIITNCISMGKNFKSEGEGGVKEEITSSVKNSSGIFGGFDASANTTVSGCAALMEEFNPDYASGVTAIEASALQSSSTYSLRGLDTEVKWHLIQDGRHLAAPYIELNFLGTWNCTCND